MRAIARQNKDIPIREYFNGRREAKMKPEG